MAKSKPAAKAKKIAAKPSKTALPFARLKRLNIFLGVVLAAEAIALIVLANNTAWPITTSYLTQDSLASAASGETILAVATHRLFDIKVVCLLAVILLVGALVRLIVSASKYRTKYEAGLKKGLSKTRQLEYIVSGGLVMVTIALLNGVYDFSTLLAIFALVEIMGLLGVILLARKDVMAKHPRATRKLIFVTGITPWLITAIYLLGAQVFGDTLLPAYVLFIDGTLLVLFAISAAGGLMQVKKKGRWADAIYAERTQVLLSALIYSALSWQIFFGILK